MDRNTRRSRAIAIAQAKHGTKLVALRYLMLAAGPLHLIFRQLDGSRLVSRLIYCNSIARGLQLLCESG